jgi:predicted Zn-dependent protease with MMP-like domain
VTDRAERVARYRAARARIAPRTSLHAFEALVAEALDDLPAFIQERLDNVAVLVEDHPARGRLERLGYDPERDLLGLYEGINQVDRAGGYHLATPDRITLFWQPILDEVGHRGREAIRQEVRATVIHELAHHFGFDDAEIERLGG